MKSLLKKPKVVFYVVNIFLLIVSFCLIVVEILLKVGIIGNNQINPKYIFQNKEIIFAVWLVFFACLFFNKFFQKEDIKDDKKIFILVTLTLSVLAITLNAISVFLMVIL